MSTTRTFLALATALALRASAEQPDTLLHAIPAPPVGTQFGAQLGRSVAVDGGLAVVGVPLDNTGGRFSGAVKVFDAASGALLHVIPNPTPAENDQFGIAVAISGTRVVVGACLDDTGVNDAGSAYMYDLSSGTPTMPMLTFHNPGPAVNDQFGASVAIFGTLVVVGATLDDTGASDTGSAYVYDLNSGMPTVPAATLNNPGPALDDRFGARVAISGIRVVVGASNDDTGAMDAGSAYVYDLGSGTPAMPVVTLNNPGPSEQDAFGISVAISGSRIVVGEHRNFAGESLAGSAHVYDLASGTPTVPVATLNNPEPATSDLFGLSVGISGTRVVVGATGDVTTADKGSVFVYDLNSGTPTVPVATFRNPGLSANDAFGGSVAIFGQWVVVGASGDDTGATDAGSAYVYDLSSPMPSVPGAMLNHPGPGTGDAFGASVAISGARVAASAYQDDSEGPDAGRVYVYDLTGGDPTVPVATFRNPRPVEKGQFGFSVAISSQWVVVGANYDDTGANSAGRAYVYDLTSSRPDEPVATLDNPTPDELDQFGYAVAISGPRVVVGAIGEDDGSGNPRGCVYVYDLSGATPEVPSLTLNNPASATAGGFGTSVAITGARVVVGATSGGVGGNTEGSAFVYDLNSAMPTVPVVTLSNPAPDLNDRFGEAVALSGTRVVVGERGGGRVRVYDLSSATPVVPVATLETPGLPGVSMFGSSVAIYGTRVVVGAQLDDTQGDNAGGAFLYDLSSGTPTVPVATFYKTSPSPGDLFGSAVSIDGMTVVIGALGDDTVMLNKGAAFVFAPADHDSDDDGLLDLWEYARFGGLGGHDADDDGDGDGRVELLEQAYDRDPLAPDAAAFPQVVNEGGYLTLTIAKRAGVTYLGQSAATPEAVAFSAMTTTVLVNDAATLKVRDNFPISTGGQRFLRVQVTAAP